MDGAVRIGLVTTCVALAVACGDNAGAASNDGAADAGMETGELLALSYNVAGLPQGLSGSMPETFTAMIGPLLNDYELVLLQESWKTPDPNPREPTRVYHEILEEASEHPHKSKAAEQPFGEDDRRPSALLSDGLNRFSNFPFEPVIREPWQMCFMSAADCLAFKGFSMGRTLFADGVEVDVYNLHMEAGGEPEDEVARDADIDQLLAFIEGNSQGRAVIVGGDFNLHTDEEPDGSQFERLLEGAGLHDACAQTDCDEPGRIDKFLLRDGDDVALSAENWNLETERFVSDDGEPLSDHDPLAVRLRWTRAR